MAGVVNVSYPAEVTERIRSGNTTGGVRMHFKSPMTKNLNSENPTEKNVNHFILIFFFFLCGGGGGGVYLLGKLEVVRTHI